CHILPVITYLELVFHSLSSYMVSNRVVISASPLRLCLVVMCRWGSALSDVLGSWNMSIKAPAPASSVPPPTGAPCWLILDITVGNSAARGETVCTACKIGRAS